MAIPARRADPTHVKVGARTFFVTSSAWGKQNLLQSDRAAKLFLLVIYDYRAQFSKGGFSFRAGKELAIRSPVCQKGFSEVRIADSEGVLQVRTYIRNNPVVRHLVADPEDYLYSSAHPGFELDPVPQGLNVLLRSG